MKPLFVVSILLVGCCWAAPQIEEQRSIAALVDSVFSTTSIDDLIQSVFNPSGTTTPQPPASLPPKVGTPNSGMNLGNDGCKCVPYYQCQNGSIVDNGVGIIDIRVQGPCDHYLDVCCEPPNVRQPTDKPVLTPEPRRGCGFRNPDGVGYRITGAKDNEAQFGEFPWMVAVLKEEAVNTNAEKLKVYQCGGALIHPEVVLTAAHCVSNKSPSELKVRAGEWDTQTKNEILPYQDREVKGIVVHEKFHAGALFNDFALLQLSQPVEIAQNVEVVCLPNHNDVFDYSRCFASGWGKDIFGKQGHYQVILKRVELPVVPHGDCQNTLRTTRLGQHFNLDQSFICAGGEPGHDTCKGDGGSPLVCPLRNNPHRYAQAGIVAWGIGCGEQIPGVYANIAYARPWIDEKMRLWNYDSREYQYY